MTEGTCYWQPECNTGKQSRKL